MALRQDLQNLVEGFIDTQVVSRGLDERTIKAYQQDLELFFRWLERGDRPLGKDCVSDV